MLGGIYIKDEASMLSGDRCFEHIQCHQVSRGNSEPSRVNLKAADLTDSASSEALLLAFKLNSDNALLHQASTCLDECWLDGDADGISSHQHIQFGSTNPL